MKFFSLSAIVVALQATYTLACSSGQPPIKDANTVTFNLFNSADSLFQTISDGVLNNCHNSNQGFTSFNMAVGQNLFGRNIHVFTYSGSGCTGNVSTDQLTNANECWFIAGSVGTANSFKIAVAS